jgi:hypothetical protein
MRRIEWRITPDLSRRYSAHDRTARGPLSVGEHIASFGSGHQRTGDTRAITMNAFVA